MTLIDLTHSSSRRAPSDNLVPVLVRSVDPIDQIPLDRLVTPATVVDLTRRKKQAKIERSDIAGTGVADIAGCILHTGWSDRYLVGMKMVVPELTINAAAYLLEGGVRTIASDFPLTSDAADLLLHNHCTLIYCLSGVAGLSKGIVRLVALPLKLEDTFSAEARVIAVEDE